MSSKISLDDDKDDNRFSIDFGSCFKMDGKSNKCPLQLKELIPFEDDLVDLVKNIKFRKVRSDFQMKLREDLRKVCSSKKTMTFADKTSNMYRLEKEEYHRLLQNAVTTAYTKSNKEAERKINCEEIKYAKEANILDKVEVNGTANCFITLKDHKTNYLNNPTTRLINPAKNEIGRISKQILDQINSRLCEILKVNEWTNTANVINRFKKVESKNSHKCLMFDITDFYPSIKEDLLIEALEFAKQHVTIKSKDRETIFHARKSLLYNEGEPWVKKQSNGIDVKMGSYDGAEVCELIGIFMLSLIGNKYNPNNIGLYRDDGLAVFKNTSGPQSENIKNTFKECLRTKV